MLPALPTFREWDGGDGYNGLKVSLSDKLGEFVPQMGNYYRSSLCGEALNVATEMLMASKLFIFELASWMNSTYTDTMARTTASEKEAWALSLTVFVWSSSCFEMLVRAGHVGRPRKGEGMWNSYGHSFSASE